MKETAFGEDSENVNRDNVAYAACFSTKPDCIRLPFINFCINQQSINRMRRRDILGLIIVKELALLDLEAGTRVGDVKMRSLPMLRADTAMCASYAFQPQYFTHCTRQCIPGSIRMVTCRIQRCNKVMQGRCCRTSHLSSLCNVAGPC